MTTRSTRHILKQVEWYHKLKTKYGCSFVAMEYTAHYKRLDVYGRTKNCEEYLIEIGYISERAKQRLENLEKTNTNIHFIWQSLGQPKKGKEIIHSKRTEYPKNKIVLPKRRKYKNRKKSKKFVKYGFYML
jgi:hypothetical protein